MKARKYLIALMAFVVIGITGCSSIDVATAPKQDQLLLQVDPILLEPIGPLITLKEYKEKEKLCVETTNKQQAK